MRVAFRACGPAAGLGGPGARRATFDPRNFPAFIEQSSQPAGVAATADVLRDGRGEGEYYKLDTLHQRRSPIVGGLTVRAATRRRQKMPSRMHGGSILGGARGFDGVCGPVWTGYVVLVEHICRS